MIMEFIKDNNLRILYKKYESMVHNLYFGQVANTKFLDPNESSLIKSLFNHHKLYYKEYKSSEDGERSIIFFSQDDFQADIYVDEKISILQAKYKIGSIGHKDILGTLMSKGIERDLIGDILIKENEFEICILSDIKDYLIFEVDKIKRVGVKLTLLDRKSLAENISNYEEGLIIVSSLRLDIIVSALTNKSRAESKNLVNRELVKVNYQIIDNPSFEININDLISIRRYGRFRIFDFLGKTKKDKYRIRYGKVI